MAIHFFRWILLVALLSSTIQRIDSLVLQNPRLFKIPASKSSGILSSHNVGLRQSKFSMSSYGSTVSSISTPASTSDGEANIMVILPDKNSLSYFKKKPTLEPITWKEVFEHIETKMKWENELLNISIVFEDELHLRTENVNEKASFHKHSDVLLLIGLNGEGKYDIFDSLAKAYSSKQFKAIAQFNCDER
jgi:hypothetical protein